MVAGAHWDWWGRRQGAQKKVEPDPMSINSSLSPSSTLLSSARTTPRRRSSRKLTIKATDLGLVTSQKAGRCGVDGGRPSLERRDVLVWSYS